MGLARKFVPVGINIILDVISLPFEAMASTTYTTVLPDPMPMYLYEGSKWSSTALYAARRLDSSTLERTGWAPWGGAALTEAGVEGSNVAIDRLFRGLVSLGIFGLLGTSFGGEARRR